MKTEVPRYAPPNGTETGKLGDTSAWLAWRVASSCPPRPYFPWHTWSTSQSGQSFPPVLRQMLATQCCCPATCLRVILQPSYRSLHNKRFHFVIPCVFQWEKDGALLNMTDEYTSLASGGALLIQVKLKIHSCLTRVKPRNCTRIRQAATPAEPATT